MGDINAVASHFLDLYYGTFDTNRNCLRDLYREVSTLTWDGQRFKGTGSIVEKLTSLPFSMAQHKILSKDVQPSKEPGSIFMTIVGLLVIDDDPDPRPYSQTLHLLYDQNVYYVANDIFRFF